MTIRQESTISFALRLLVLGLLCLAGAGLALSSNVVLAVIGVFLLGAMFAHAVELQHQCLHHTAFRSRKVNRIVGVLLGLPTLTSYHSYRRSHLEHHRNLGTSADTPFFTYRSTVSPSVGAIIFDLLGISHLKTSISAIFGNGDSRLLAASQGDEFANGSEQFDYGLMGFLIILACLVSMEFGPMLILKLWVIPFVLIAQPIHFLVEIPEHLGCSIDSPDVFRNTRTIVGSKFSRWFTNFNNLHVEHHIEPSVNMSQLPAVFERFNGRHKHLEQTYWQFYLSFYKLIKSQPFESIANQARRPV